MNYRTLGKTGLKVSEIGLGGEWLERHNYEETKAVIDTCAEEGINILDCWMPEPNVRSNIGKAIRETREKWMIQGHIGSTWQNGQYVLTRPAVASVLVGYDTPEHVREACAYENADETQKDYAAGSPCIREIALSGIEGKHERLCGVWRL